MFSGFLSKTCSVGGGGFCLKPSGSFIYLFKYIYIRKTIKIYLINIHEKL